MLFRAKANKALDRAEDPREMLDYSYERQLELLQQVRRPATRKKKAISPEFTQPCQLSANSLVPDRITSMVSHVAAYPAGSMLAHASAASVAASKTTALPVSVRKNRRSGVCRFYVHTVRSETATRRRRARSLENSLALHSTRRSARQQPVSR